MTININSTGTEPASNLPVSITTPPARSTSIAPRSRSLPRMGMRSSSTIRARRPAGPRRLTISANYGNLSLTQHAGVTIGISNGSSGLSLYGTVSAIDAAVDGLVTRPIAASPASTRSSSATSTTRTAPSHISAPTPTKASASWSAPPARECRSACRRRANRPAPRALGLFAR